MSSDYDPVETYATAPPRRSWLRPLLLPGIAFLLGLGAMGYILAHWETGARALGIAAAPEPAAQPATAQPQIVTAPAPATQPAPAPTDPAANGTTPERIAIDPEIARRVAALEARIGTVDSQSRNAVGNADRAESLLVAFAARRALDRGTGLGFLEGMLQQRFGQSQPRAVGMIILASQHPVTLQELQAGLQEVGPRLLGTPPDASWWDSFTAELGSLITIRRAGSPSPDPAEGLRRAQQRLDAGQVQIALAEVLRLPARDNGADWITKARLYVAARDALDSIETAALVAPGPAEPTPATAQPAAAPTPAPAPARPAAHPAAARPAPRAH